MKSLVHSCGVTVGPEKKQLDLWVGIGPLKTFGPPDPHVTMWSRCREEPHRAGRDLQLQVHEAEAARPGAAHRVRQQPHALPGYVNHMHHLGTSTTCTTWVRQPHALPGYVNHMHYLGTSTTRTTWVRQPHALLVSGYVNHMHYLGTSTTRTTWVRQPHALPGYVNHTHYSYLGTSTTCTTWVCQLQALSWNCLKKYNDLHSVVFQIFSRTHGVCPAQSHNPFLFSKQ